MKLTKKQKNKREALRLKLRDYYKSVSRAMIEELSKHGIETEASVVSKFFAGTYSKDYNTWLKVIKALLERGERELSKSESRLDDLIEYPKN